MPQVYVGFSPTWVGDEYNYNHTRLSSMPQQMNCCIIIIYKLKRQEGGERVGMCLDDLHLHYRTLKVAEELVAESRHTFQYAMNLRDVDPLPYM